MELNDKNILNVLHEAEFADAHWELIGMQLIKRLTVLNIRANRHGDSSLCMIDTIAQWLRTDTKASWEKLAEAVAKLEQYGEATANIVRQEAGIGKAVGATLIPVSALIFYDVVMIACYCSYPAQ